MFYSDRYIEYLGGEVTTCPVGMSRQFPFPLPTFYTDDLTLMEVSVEPNREKYYVQAEL